MKKKGIRTFIKGSKRLIKEKIKKTVCSIKTLFARIDRKSVV